MSKETNEKITTRRRMLGGAAAVGMAGLVAGRTADAAQAPGATGCTIDPAQKMSVLKNGKYETVPLRQDTISIAAIQSRTKSVDVRNLKASMRENLDHMLGLIDSAQGHNEAWGEGRKWGGKQDLICMHEFPLQGFQPWNRKELNRVAIELPGPEVEAIGARAKKYGCYIGFGCYAKEKDWPDHVINMSVIIGPDGNVISKQWKCRNELGLEEAFGGKMGLLSSTVYDVLDRYVEMYGWDAVLPVVRTDIGNVSMTSATNEPLLDAALALKGAEILILSVTGGSNRVHASSSARSNRIYTVGVCNSVTFDNIGFTESAGATDGGTVICDPRGATIGKTTTHHEDIAMAHVSMAQFRKTRRTKELPMEMFQPIFQQYEPAFKKNAFLEYLPKDLQDSGDFVYKRLGWD